ncbi:hypothetical protein BD560DRAFT_394930 [Blakeslea trispora]|nr:hypothetical protein BD560DRAFT_394930 [Blakeslea trispora]
MTVPSSPFDLSTSHLPQSFSELSRRATVDKADMSKYTIKPLISLVGKLYDQGDFEYKRGMHGNAYVYYMKGCSIMVEVIAKHPNIKEAKRDFAYKQLKARTNDEILALLEELTLKLQKADQNLDNSVMERYPSISELSNVDQFLTHLPSVPTHSPTKPNNRQQLSSPPTTPPPSVDGIMKMPEPEPVSDSQPPPAPHQIRLPSPTKSLDIPFTLTVDPMQLASWIVKKSDRQQPSVLILDVRPRQVFDQGFIKHTWIAQIEPLILNQNVTSSKIEESLVLNPEAEQQTFACRNRFDIIVYYDQNSQSLNTPTLANLRQAIYEMEFTKILQRAPIMLSGGFDAWQSVIGERGIFSYHKNTNPLPHHKENIGLFQPVKVHQTIYDYFSYPGSPKRKESMTKYNNHTLHKNTPPLQGIFSNTLYTNEPTTNYSMPMPQPVNNDTKTDNYPTSTQYPHIQPNLSANLTRKKTFIDNPYYGFTSTTNKQFDIPPLPPKLAHTSELPPPLPPKPLAASPPKTDGYRTAPVSDNTFSQMGNVMIGTTGLKNLGNTCFMNSIIQCLSGTIPFARYFTSGIFRQHINKENFLGTGGVLAEGFADLLRTMWSGNYNFTSPATFREALIKFAPQFRGSEQHDSQEFLNFLLDGLHEDCNLVIKKPSPPAESPEEEARFEALPDWQASSIAWERYLERNSSIVVSLFQGQYRSRLTCLTCHTTSTTYNSFMSLSLPIPAKRSGPSSVSIYQCLDYFVKEEILDDDDAWQCPKCKALRRASKSLTISRLPDVLLIHLKRFSYDGPFKDKLETNVESPMVGLDLSRYVPSSMFSPDHPPDRSSFSYDLYAVSNHYGSLSGGHYTACVRNGYRNEWHNFDDSRFSVCDSSKVLSRAAYNLFYVRSTVK